MMKKKLLFAATAILPSLPAFADGPTPSAERNWYVEGYGGAAFAPDLSYGTGEFEMENGYNVGGAIGRHLNENWDVEIDVFYAELGYKGFETNINGLSVMFDVIYNFKTGWAIDPYVGGGLGTTRVQYDGENQFPAFTGEEWLVGYQLMGGLIFEVNETLDFFAEYRWHDVTSDAEIENIDDIEYMSHNISAGIRLNF